MYALIESQKSGACEKGDMGLTSKPECGTFTKSKPQ